MPELKMLQELFGAAMSARDERALPLIAGDEAEARKRLAIYRANIAANAAGALAAIYPIVRTLVGAEFFAGLAQAYSAAHPSASGDLNELGAHLADFLPAFAPAHSLPYLPDVARLEWLAHRAHYAADHPPLDVTAVAGFTESDYARLAMTLHPAVGVLSSAYPLFRIWEVHQDDYRGELAVDLSSGGEHVVIYRPQFRAAVARLSTGEAVFLAAVARGALLGPALADALNNDPGFNFAASLQNWARANIVVALRATH
ncbi:MAG: DNA-binding domain-containing protein [Betaproteobacteria bacterium]